MEIPGKAMHIYLQPNAVPSQISIARLVPLRMQHAATQVIHSLLQQKSCSLSRKAPNFLPN